MYFPIISIAFLLFLLEYIETCPDGCINCENTNKCKYCISGYYEINIPNSSYVNCGKCLVDNCHSCSASTPNKCSSCDYVYYLKDENCLKCDSNCGKCEYSASYCTSCSSGYYLLNTKCFQCDSNCKNCEISSSHCTDCFDGKYLSNANCFPCDSNCKTCRTNATNCLSCVDGKYLSNSICLLCDPNCKTCKTNATNCLSCNQGDYLAPNNTCVKCPNICKECQNENKCSSCIDDYFLFNNQCYKCNLNCSTSNDGCKCNTCEEGFYLKNYQCLQCNSLCVTCIQQDLCTKCITNYYKKEDDPLNNGRNFICYKELEGYYLDNNIYKKCYQTCRECTKGGSKKFHNCTECDVNLPFEVKRNNFINCYNNCSNYFYFDSNDNFHCTYNLSCPYKYPYLLENRFECIELNLDEILDRSLINGLSGTGLREEEIKFYDNILKSLEDGFTSDLYNPSDLNNGKEQILKTEKLTLTFTTTRNQRNNINNNVNNNMTTIDLGECETLLRNFYHIPDNEPLYMKKVDIMQDGMKTLKVEYDIYARLFEKNLINLNLTICEKSKISISIPIKITEQLDKLNSSSAYYNDICYTTISEDGTDIVMKDRKNEFIDKDRIVCQDDCFFSEYDYVNSKAKCLCNVKKCSQSYSDMKINKEKILDNLKNINNLINFKFLICYKKLFTKEGIFKNIGNYIIFSIIIFHIISIFIFSLMQFSSITKKIEKIALEKYGELSVKKNDKKEKIVKPIIYQIVKKIKISRRFSKKKFSYNKNPSNDSRFKININNINFRINKNDKGNMENFIDEEINGFSYILSLKIDKRTFCQYYLSLLKTQHSLLCALFNINDYNSRIIKFNLFIIGFTIEYTINALFYNDDTMHKIYQNKGLFDLETQLPIALYSTVISTILNYPLNFLALSNDAIINFKQDNSKINIKIKAKNLKKMLFIKFSLYFIISFLFLLFFWYYLSIFCVIYKNTQIHLLKDTLMSIGFSLVFPFGIYLLPGIMRIPSLSAKNKKRECLYNFSKILQSL